MPSPASPLDSLQSLLDGRIAAASRLHGRCRRPVVAAPEFDCPADEYEHRLALRVAAARDRIVRWGVWWLVGEFAVCVLLVRFGHDWSTLTGRGWAILYGGWVLNCVPAAYAAGAALRVITDLRPIWGVAGFAPWAVHLLWVAIGLLAYL